MRRIFIVTFMALFFIGCTSASDSTFQSHEQLKISDSVVDTKKAPAQTHTIVGPIKGNQEVSKLVAPNSMFEFQDLSDPEIDWLAGNYVYPWLEKKLGPNWRDKTQWEQIIEVRKWAHQMMTAYGGQAGEPSPYVIDKRGYPYGMKDPIYPRYIIEWAEAGGRAECSNWNRLFMAGLHTIGVRSRLGSVIHYNNGDPKSDTVIEVYSVDYHKWVLMHAEFNSFVHLGDNIPLSATEVYYAARQGKLDLIQYEQSPPTYCKETGKEEKLSIPDPYLRWHLQRGYNPQNWEWKSFFKNIVIFQSDKVFEIAGNWYGTTMAKMQVIYNPAYSQESYPISDRVTDHSKINWSVNEIHVDIVKIDTNTIFLRMKNNIQGFASYRIRVDRTTGPGEWRNISSSYLMRIDEGVTAVMVGAIDIRGSMVSNRVEIPIISKIQIYPRKHRGDYLAGTKFFAKAYDANGKEISIITPLWKSDNGSITPDGTFTPSGEGIITITATYEGITETMIIPVEKDDLDLAS